jgi:hypothetical protein
MARFVSPAYFEVMGLPIVRGRGFNDADRAGTPLVMVVNQTLAQRLWPNQDPIGRRVNGSAGKGAKTVIGVVPDVRFAGPGAPPEPEFYQPLAQLEDIAWNWTRRSLFVVARTDADPASLATGALDIGALEIAQLANNPNFRERGRLTLEAGGGR